MALWLDQDLNAGEQLKVELREDEVRFVAPSGGDGVSLRPMTHQEAVLQAIALRKAYKRLEEIAVTLPDTRDRRR